MKRISAQKCRDVGSRAGLGNVKWLSAKIKIGKVGWDSVCQAKAFELYSVGNGQLLKVYKMGLM